MENHFHLLATPQTDTGLTQLMQAVGRRYVRYFNDTHHRTGTLWEGRYRSTVLEAEPYLLPCMAYLDLNPVRSGLVMQAGDYPWSSFGHYSGLRADKLLTSHPHIWALGNTPFAREAAYTQMVQAGISAVQQAALTDATLSGWALGTPEFVEDLQKMTPRRLTKGRAGRPVSKPYLFNK
jgi:putative transposase